jgi:hypothetical protein
MVCVECVLATIPKGGEIHKASYSSFIFFTKIGSLLNFIAKNVQRRLTNMRRRWNAYIYIKDYESTVKQDD